MHNLVRHIMIGMFLSLVFFIRTPKLWAQSGGEFGLHAGASYYLGDLNWAKQFYDLHFTGGAFYKHHFNSRYIAKIGVLTTSLSADDADSKWEYQKLRNRSFYTPVYELSMQAEVNFFTFEIGEERKNNHSPYLDVGVAFNLAPDADALAFVSFPIAVGYKANLSKRIIFSIEWAFRKCLTDELDALSGEDLSIYENNTIPVSSSHNHKQLGFLMNDDWHSYVAFSLSYAFKIHNFGCPAYY